MANTKFEQELVNIQPNLYNFAYMLTSNREDANDLVQDTTLKVLSSEDKYVDNINFRGWVMTIMRNIFINQYRKMTRNATVVDRSANLYQLNLPQDSGFETPEGTITVIEINNVLNRFSDDYRIPFKMHLAGYKYSEIAVHTNLPLSTVKSRIFFARKRLQTLLADLRPGMSSLGSFQRHNR